MLSAKRNGRIREYRERGPHAIEEEVNTIDELTKFRIFESWKVANAAIRKFINPSIQAFTIPPCWAWLLPLVQPLFLRGTSPWHRPGSGSGAHFTDYRAGQNKSPSLLTMGRTIRTHCGCLTS